MTTFYGHFKQYQPAGQSPNVLFYRNEDGLDFYTLTRGITQWDAFGNFLTSSTGQMFIAVREGVIQSASLDVSRLVPADCDVFGIEPTNSVPQFGDLWIDGAVTAPPVDTSAPKSVTMRQARLALSKAGLYTAVQDALATIPGTAGEEARIEWEYGSDVYRDSALILALGAAVALDDDEIDDLFRSAALL